jgi:hypothetical protein
VKTFHTLTSGAAAVLRTGQAAWEMFQTVMAGGEVAIDRKGTTSRWWSGTSRDIL